MPAGPWALSWLFWLALAELRLSRGAADERTQDLARRAVFFGGGAEAEEVLERAGGAPAAGAAEPGVG